MSTYVFGDIQGCFDELTALLDLVQFDKEKDKLCFLGDLINRGKKNLETIEFIMSLKHSEIILGNHDLHFLAVASRRKKISTKDTFGDVISSPKLPEIIDWMRSQALILRIEEFNYSLVHAGIPPNWSVAEALSYGREVEDVLKGEDYKHFLDHMYGNEPAVWSPALVGWDRLRVITNSLTRLRYCDAKGTMEFKHKTKLQPEGYKPWFSYERKNDHILFGHWAAIEGDTGKDNIRALDTGCVWGRKLTCLRLEDQNLFSVAAINN
ncbi:MAG: bis(5'-nucleosyl)-tetraphosphatase (symmetrical) [Candidatus Azotimanducaceae bacterium]|jgi:bis(5'-nucleosyl)-tetraphosphatase (symmetrical)